MNKPTFNLRACSYRERSTFIMNEADFANVIDMADLQRRLDVRDALIAKLLVSLPDNWLVEGETAPAKWDLDSLRDKVSGEFGDTLGKELMDAFTNRPKA